MTNLSVCISELYSSAYNYTLEQNISTEAEKLQNDTDEGVANSLQMTAAQEQQCKIFDFFLEAVVMGTLCIFGFIGNTLSFIVLRKHKSKSPTPTLFIALGVADTLFLIIVVLLRTIPTLLIYFNLHIPLFYPYLGVYMWPEALMAETATIWLTVLVTINRYVSVCRPLHAASTCSKTTAYRHVVLITLFAVAYNIPRFFEYRVTSFSNPTTNKTILYSELTSFGKNKLYRIIYGNVMYFLMIYIVPLGMLIIFNVKLMLLLKKSRKERGVMLATGGGRLNSNSNGASSKQEQDITLMLICVVLVFIICKSPALLTHALLSIIPETQIGCPTFYFYYSRISDLMVVISSSTNFVVYCFCSRKFRHILKLVLCRRTRIISRTSSSKRYTSYSSVRDASNSSGKRCRGRLPETVTSFRMREMDPLYNCGSTGKFDSISSIN